MVNIASLEKEKYEILANHIRIYHNTELSEVERTRIDELNLEITKMKIIEYGVKHIYDKGFLDGYNKRIVEEKEKHEHE